MKRIVVIVFIMLATLCAAQSSRHRWKVVVIVPEQHISRPHIPDPAVETELNRQLIEAGYKVIDQERVRALISNSVEDRLMRKDNMARAECQRIARKLGADVVLTGSAFTQVSSRSQVSTDIGQTERIFCRARIELRAYLADTGEMKFSDAITKTGQPESTEELSSKTALKDAAEEIGPSVIKAFDKFGTSQDVTVNIEVRNVSFSMGSDLREILRRISGAVEISEGEYDAAIWTFDVTVKRANYPRLPANFEQNSMLKKRHLVVQQANKTKIILNHK